MKLYNYLQQKKNDFKKFWNVEKNNEPTSKQTNNQIIMLLNSCCVRESNKTYVNHRS